MLSSSTGTFLGTGTVLTQNNFIVQVRNPPRPPARENEITVEVDTETSSTDEQIGRTTLPEGREEVDGEEWLREEEEEQNKLQRQWQKEEEKVRVKKGRGSRKSGGRDPLCQSFTVNETGAFLTSFDVYFASKDPNAKLTVQLRTMELGTPTQNLVQDFCEITVNPDYINVSNDASVPTTFRFQSPVYLPPDEEFALVFISASTDKYTMWCATMGEKSVKTTQLPDVQNVVVSKQYLGGSLFKSQNGTIWTASQNQDLAFKLRKAQVCWRWYC